MHQIIVISIPYSYLPFQVSNAHKNISIIETFLVASMTSLHYAVLRRFSRINEVMDDIILGATPIKCMELSRRKIFSFICACISIGKYKAIICFHRLDDVVKSLHNFQKKKN